MDREKAIKWIEENVGYVSPIWHEWPDEDLKRLYVFLCKWDHGRVTIEDSERVGVTLR